jgi:anti-sigma B factor antagonist
MTGHTARFAVGSEQLDDQTVVVNVSGEVDIGTAPEFEDELARAVEDRLRSALVVDLTGVGFIDSTGLNALVRALERQRLVGSSLVLVSDDSRVAMMLEVTRLDRVLRRYRTRDEALAAVREG